MRKIILLIGLLLMLPVLMGVGLGPGLFEGGSGSTGSSTPPASGVDSEVTLYENSDASGDNTASIVIDAAEDLTTNQAIYASNMGWMVPYPVRCYARRWNVTTGDRLLCAFNNNSFEPEAFTGTRTNIEQQGYKEMVPPGLDLKILALEVLIGGTTGGGNTDDCAIGVETNTSGDRVFDPTAAGGYTDSFTVRGALIEIGQSADNSALSGWGDDTPYQIGQGYILPIHYTLASGYFIITAQSPIPGTEDCNYMSDDVITVWVQRVPE